MSILEDVPPSLDNSIHTVLKTNFHPDYKYDDEIMSEIVVGMGCFWGAEKLFWDKMPNEDIFSTSVGYSGGVDGETSYKAVCSGRTGHIEVVRLVYRKKSLKTLLKLFWENHDPLQWNRQGEDIGSHFRSAIFCSSEEQLKTAIESRESIEKEMANRGILKKTKTEISIIRNFYLAELYHQQYLDKNPFGYCGLKGKPMSLPACVCCL